MAVPGQRRPVEVESYDGRRVGAFADTVVLRTIGNHPFVPHPDDQHCVVTSECSDGLACGYPEHDPVHVV